MKNICIKLTLEGKKQKADFDLPECWEEVPDNDFQGLVSLYLKTPEQMDTYDKTVRVFVLLAGAKAWQVLQHLEPDELYLLLNHINWVFDELLLSRNPIKQVQTKKAVLIGPANGLENMRFGEWIVADGYFVDYAQTNNTNALDALVAVIYREQGNGSAYQEESADYRGDFREKFNDQTVGARIRQLEKVKPETKKAIFVWYASCRQQIISRYPDFFPQNSKPAEQSEGWFGLYDDLMGDPKFGGAEKLEDTFVHTVFASVNRSQIKMKELKDKYDL